MKFNYKDMNNLVNKNKYRFFYLWKPSKIFWILTIFILFIWFFLGPISWRHIDDFGPIQLYLSGDEPLFSKYRLFKGWGTYPPIWSLWSFLSISLKFIGITETRYILLFQGFLSTIISCYLTVCVCLNLLSKFIKKFNLKFGFCKQIIEFLAIIFNCLNPEIMFHASTYMPYNLSSITTLFLLLILIPPDKENIEDIGKYYLFFKLPFNYFILLAFLSTLFGFQSIILLVSFFLTSFVIFKNIVFEFSQLILKNIKSKTIFNFKYQKLYFQNNLIFINFCFFVFLLTSSYCIKFINLIKSETKPGLWAKGFDGIYDISLNNNQISELSLKILNNIISILGQSLYPFRNFQEQASLIIFLLVLSSLFFIFKINKSGIVLIINSFISFSLSILLAINGSFTFSPTRHTIFLYPYIWILLIIYFLIFLEITRKKIINVPDKIIINFLIGIFIIQSIGLISSHNLIQYSRELRNDLLRISMSADYHINRFNNSFFISHGNEEFKMIGKNICPKKDIKIFNLFIYNHRKSLKLNREDIENIIKNSEGCINYDDEIQIIEKLEKVNKLDIEQNNNIFNGGSSAYGYILEIKRPQHKN